VVSGADQRRGTPLLSDVERSASDRTVRDVAAEAKLDRRTFVASAFAVGFAFSPLAAMLTSCSDGAEGDDERLRAAFPDWILRLHPTVDPAATAPGRPTELVRPLSGADPNRAMALARERRSDWDVLFGITPFADLVKLVDAGAVEPWDAYIPREVIADLPPVVRGECSVAGRRYSWPFLLDVLIQGWNTELVERAGLDPTRAPRDWDEYVQNARIVRSSGAAPYGCTFDARGWRSLLPIACSIDPGVYRSDGLFDYTHDAVVEALEVMRRMYEVSHPDVLDLGTTAGAGWTPDEGAFAAQNAAYYVKYQNAHVRFAATWPDPGRLALGPLPKGSRNGRTVFWTTGAALLRYGRQKRTASRYVRALTYDEVVWRNSLSGRGAGHLPVYRSLWKQWEQPTVDWLDRWASRIYAELNRAIPIRPHRLGTRQFTIAQPHWETYLRGDQPNPKMALRAAMKAVRAVAD
jgi:multiple sugar transport system substrate-binding protein